MKIIIRSYWHILLQSRLLCKRAKPFANRSVRFIALHSRTCSSRYDFHSLQAFVALVGFLLKVWHAFCKLHVLMYVQNFKKKKSSEEVDRLGWSIERFQKTSAVSQGTGMTFSLVSVLVQRDRVLCSLLRRVEHSHQARKQFGTPGGTKPPAPP